MRFDRCELGYIVGSEGPQRSVVFEEWVEEGEEGIEWDELGRDGEL